MRILVTGATGFVGQALCSRLIADQYWISAAVRSQTSQLSPSIQLKQVHIGEIDATTDWTKALQEVDVIVHLAARVHVMRDQAADPLAAFISTNTEGTVNLARQAATAGVQRFIFISSIKVNGEETRSDDHKQGWHEAFRETDAAYPGDPYAISKWQAECGLRQLSAQFGMEVVILRPPLIYGPGVKGNFALLIDLIRKGIPLPLGAVRNRRSFLALDNLVHFIALCIDREQSAQAANEVFLLSDGEDVSTPDLLRRIGQAYHKRTRLLPVPVCYLRWAAHIAGKDDIADRLIRSLVVDSSKARDLLGWQPAVTMEQQLQKMAGNAALT